MTKPEETPLYVFIIDDQGLIQTILADSDLSKLAARAMSSIDAYLNTYGYRETKDSTPTTEDGFAEIYRAIEGETKPADTIWTYKFDGDQSLVEAGDILDEAIKDDAEKLEASAAILHEATKLVGIQEIVRGIVAGYGREWVHSRGKKPKRCGL
jgi:hypothetical protein